MEAPARRFVILDRDGTIIVDKHYLSDTRQVELLPGAAEGLRKMRALGLALLVVSNQSGVGRGYFGLAEVERINARMAEMLMEQGIKLEGIYFCPHAPEENCACRKPKTGLVDRAKMEIGFDSALCFVIGDKKADIEMGKALNAHTILVRTGFGAQVEAEGFAASDCVVDDLAEAAQIIKKALSSDC